MKIIFTDLDGTLLHLRTYSPDAARPALEALSLQGIPLVFCTSKPRAEVEFWRERLHNAHPFVVENGGAVYIPRGYFGSAVPGAQLRDGYEVLAFGAAYGDLVADLRAAARESGCEVRGFHDLSVAEICLRTLLPVRQAELARQREYDEPFEILSGATYVLLNAIEARGRRWTRGNRFYHITGNHDKAGAVRCLTELYRRAGGATLTVGIGDGHNDTPFLGAVDIPFVVHSEYAAALKKSVPRSRVTRAPGPHGWTEAVLQVMAA